MNNEPLAHAITSSAHATDRLDHYASERAYAATQHGLWLRALLLSSSTALVFVAISFTGARSSAWWSDSLFWLAILAIFVPTAFRLLVPQITRTECVSLLAFLGMALYIVKVLHSPTAFTFYDELLHVRTVSDVQQSHALFTRNPLLPVSSLFPGLHSLTAAVEDLTGLGIFEAGVIVIGVARLTIILALFLFLETITRSTPIATFGTLTYIANPAFVFFNAQFAYESLALPLMVLALFLQTKLLHHTPRSGVGLHVMLALVIGAVIITHHITTYFLLVFLLMWTIAPSARAPASVLIQWYAGELPTWRLWSALRPPCTARGTVEPAATDTAARLPLWTLIGAAIATGLWTTFVAQYVLGYVGSYLWYGLVQIFNLIIGADQPRRLFRGFKGEDAPVWEQLVGYGAVAISAVLLPFGLRSIARHYGRNQSALMLAALALAYPASQAIRFTDLGLQIAARSVEFLYLPIAFVIAVWMRWTSLHPRIARWRRGILTLGVTILFAGGVILGWPRWARLPKPYLVSADTRSIEAQSIAGATWSQTILQPGQRFAADRINGLLLGTYGKQYVVSLAYDNINVPQVYFAPTLGVEELAVLDAARIEYLLVDRRLSTQLPGGGIYFELGEPNMNRHTSPLPPAALGKFDQAPLMQRVYDSGDIVIYQLNREQGP